MSDGVKLLANRIESNLGKGVRTCLLVGAELDWVLAALRATKCAPDARTADLVGPGTPKSLE